MKKTFLILITLTLLAVGAYRLQGNHDTNGEEKPVVTTVKAERRSIRHTISSSGRVTSRLDVEIKCKASGQVTSLPFDVSDRIKKGDLLLELDPADEMRKLRQAEVAVASSRADLIKAQKNLIIAEKTLLIDKEQAKFVLKAARVTAQDAKTKAVRIEKLLKKKLSSIERFDTAKTNATNMDAALEETLIKIRELKVREISLQLKQQDVLLAKAQLESDTIKKELARQSLSDTKVHAPIDGVITAKNVQQGQIISSGISNVGGGTTILTISDLSRIFILASVDESDIGVIEIGQRTEITVDAYPEKKFSGKVVQIAPRGINSSNVVTFEVKIEVMEESKSLLKIEMTANVEIIVAEKEKVITLPVETIFREKGKYLVTVFLDETKQERRSVAIGITDGVYREVVEGILEGEPVVVHQGEAQSRWRKSKVLQEKRKGRTMRMMFGKKRGKR